MENLYYPSNIDITFQSPEGDYTILNTRLKKLESLIAQYVPNEKVFIELKEEKRGTYLICQKFDNLPRYISKIKDVEYFNINSYYHINLLSQEVDRLIHHHEYEYLAHPLTIDKKIQYKKVNRYIDKDGDFGFTTNDFHNVGEEYINTSIQIQECLLKINLIEPECYTEVIITESTDEDKFSITAMLKTVKSDDIIIELPERILSSQDYEKFDKKSEVRDEYLSELFENLNREINIHPIYKYFKNKIDFKEKLAIDLPEKESQKKLKI